VCGNKIYGIGMYILDYICGCKYGKVVGYHMILVFLMKLAILK